MDTKIKDVFGRIVKAVDKACQGYINQKITSNTIQKIKQGICDHLKNIDKEKCDKIKKIIDAWNFDSENDTLVPADGKTAITFFLLTYKVESIDTILSLLEFPDLYEYKNNNIFIKWENKKIYIQPKKPLEYIEVNFVVDKDGNIKT